MTCMTFTYYRSVGTIRYEIIFIMYWLKEDTKQVMQW